MSKIQAMMANRDAVVAFIGEFNAQNDKPCPSKVIAEKFVDIDTKKLLPLLKEDGAIASEKGRYGGYMTLDFANVRAANKAESKAVKKTTTKTTKTSKKSSKVVEVNAALEHITGEPVSKEESNKLLGEVRDIIKNYKKPAPVAKVEIEEDEEEDDVKPLSFEDATGPSADDLEDIDDEYTSLMNDMNDIVGANTFAEAE
jgi:hypothetical protein